MVFNVDKCKVMHVGNWEDSRTYYMDDGELSVVSYEKDLGVWISADMKCSKQSMYACNKTMKVLGMIKRTIRFKDMRVMLVCINHWLGLTLSIVSVLGIHITRKTKNSSRRFRDLQK